MNLVNRRQTTEREESPFPSWKLWCIRRHPSPPPPPPPSPPICSSVNDHQSISYYCHMLGGGGVSRGGDFYWGYDDTLEMKVSREGDYCFWRELVPVFDRAGKECVVFVMSAAANVGTLPFLWFQVWELHTYFSSGYVVSEHDKPGLLELSCSFVNCLQLLHILWFRTCCLNTNQLETCV